MISAIQSVTQEGVRDLQQSGEFAVVPYPAFTVRHYPVDSLSARSKTKTLSTIGRVID